MIKDCYEHAGENVILSDACDLFEKDVNKILWNEMNFYELVLYNKDKYTFVYEKMAEEVFTILIDFLKILYFELSDLIEEINAHRDVMVVRIKGHVDDRTNHIVEEARAYARNPEPKIQKYQIEVTQSVNDPGSKFEGLELPRPIRIDGETREIFHGDNPYQKIADEVEEMGHTRLENMYGGNRHEQVEYDPDHYANQTHSHKDYQELAMNNMFGKTSLINGEAEGNIEENVNNISADGNEQEYEDDVDPLSEHIYKRRFLRGQYRQPRGNYRQVRRSRDRRVRNRNQRQRQRQRPGRYSI